MGQKARRIGLVSMMAFVFVTFTFLMAGAQEFPTKPITLVNPGGPGGSHDLTARAVTSVAADYLGQPIVVKVMVGGGGRGLFLITETLLPPTFAIAKSAFPSPSKSPIATQLGPVLVVKSTLVA